MKKWLIRIGCILIVGAGLSVFAADTGEDWNFRGKVNYDQGAIWQIKAVEVTATATQLNACAAGSAATLTPTTVSNPVMKVFADDIAVGAGGTFSDTATSTNTIIGLTTASNAANVVYGKHIMATAGGGFRDAATSTNTITGITVISGTGCLVSNATAKVYGKTIVIVGGGGITDAATSTNTIAGVTTFSSSPSLNGGLTIKGTVSFSASTNTITGPTTLSGGTTLTNTLIKIFPRSGTQDCVVGEVYYDSTNTLKVFGL